MRRRLAAVLAATILAGGCTHAVDTTVRPAPAVTYAPLRHPFLGARLYVDPDSAAARWRARTGARWLDPIADTPQAVWVTSPQDLGRLPRLVRDTHRGGELLVLVAYYLPNRGCADFKEGAPDAAAYRSWVETLVRRLGGTEAVVVVEPDAVPADCFDAARARLLADAVERMSAAGHHVYLDAGHARWRPSGETAERLLAAGIANAEGFSVNVANRQSLADSHRWGMELSDLVGDRDFVIDTSRNGLGPPPDDPARDDEWCNPERQGLGAPPTTDPRLDRVAALLWVKRPGESDGPCGGEKTYLFSPRQARTLIANAPRTT